LTDVPIARTNRRLWVSIAAKWWIGYEAWIEDANGNEIEEPALKKLNQSHQRSNQLR
jgi:hypothetical protein